MYHNSISLLRFLLQRNLLLPSLSLFLSILPNFFLIFYKYSSSNLLLFHLNKILAIYFPSNSLLLNSFASGFNSTSISLCFPFLFFICHSSSSPISFSNSSTKNPSHSSNFLISPKCFLLPYNPFISLNTLVFPFSLFYPKSFLLYIPSHQLPQQEVVVFSFALLSALNTSLFFSHSLPGIFLTVLVAPTLLHFLI